MPDHRFRSFVPVGAGVALVAALVACNADGPTVASPNVRPAEEMHFLRPSLNAPPLSSLSVSFYAVRGQDREAVMWYAPRPGRTDSSTFVRFRVRGESLDRRPDGTVFLPGDSVLITIQVTDPARMILDFQPSGLRFSTSAPADLKINFAEASRDLDGDGDVDADDATHETQLAIWKQEAPGLPWARLTSLLDLTVDELETQVTGFTGYAISY